MAICISDVNTVCDEIHNLVQMSGLHFVINQTPWSSYITIRRKFINPGVYNVTIKSPETVVTNQLKEKNEHLEQKLSEDKLELAEIAEELTNEKENNKKTVDYLDSKIDALENAKIANDSIIQNINAHFNSKVSELNSKVVELENFKKETHKMEKKALKKQKQKLLKVDKNRNDAGEKDVNENNLKDGVSRGEEISTDNSANTEPSSLLLPCSPTRQCSPPARRIPVLTTPPPSRCLARGPLATPPSPHTPPGLPPFTSTSSELQDNPSPTLSRYFDDCASLDFVQTKPNEPILTTEYIKNISKFSLVPRQKRN